MADDEGTFSAAERQAMKDRAAELRSQKGGAKKEKDLAALLAKIAEFEPADRALSERVHAMMTRIAPELDPKLFYGMPSYAKDGAVLCFLQPAGKFETRYATFGFNDGAALDDGDLWPASFAVARWTDAVEQQITELVLKALGRSDQG